MQQGLSQPILMLLYVITGGSMEASGEVDVKLIKAKGGLKVKSKNA